MNYRINNQQDLIDLIEEWDFVPFFANEIPGFSIEENIRPNREGYDFEKDTQAFCARKYTSDFSIEMTRSAEVYLQDFAFNICI